MTTKEIISAEKLASAYWRKMRFAAIREVELRLQHYKSASPQTLRYWLAVHTALERFASKVKRERNESK